MNEFVVPITTGLVTLLGSTAFGEFLRYRRQGREGKLQEKQQLVVRILEEGHTLRQDAYQREREALQTLAEERERRHKAELAALEAQMQATVDVLTRVNEALTQNLERANALISRWDKGEPLSPLCRRSSLALTGEVCGGLWAGGILLALLARVEWTGTVT